MRTLTLALIAVVLVASTASAQEPSHRMTVALAAMTIGQTADTWTTIAALNRGAVSETNALLGTHPSAVKLIVAKLPMIGIGWLLTKIAPQHPKLAQGTAYVIGGIGAGLAFSNSRTGRR
jgi:hypothetical protein